MSRSLGRVSLWLLVVSVLSVSCSVDQLINPAGDRAFPPSPPAELTQFRSDGVTPIASGATIDEASLVLRAVVADSEVNDTIRLQAEVRAVGTDFTGSPTHTSAPVVSGAAASVSVGALDPNTSYRWQARAIDRFGRTSDWVAFGSGPLDFRVAIPRGPTAPTDAAQMRADGNTPLGVGATSTELTVVLAATVDDPDDDATVRLEIELRPVTTPFNGTPTAVSAPVAKGARASVSASVSDDVSYHWQYRANDGTGRFSAWQTFGANPEDAADFKVAIDEAPGSSASGQFRADGVTPIGVGGVTSETQVVLAATPVDPDAGDILRVQIEVQRSDVPFTGTPTHTSATTTSGNRAGVTVDVVDDASYHWQYRTIDQTNLAGPWAEFGGNATSAADFTVNVPGNPDPPTLAGQFRTNGATPILIGGTTNQQSVVLSALVSDPDLGSSLRFEVELAPLSSAFTGTPSHSSTSVSSGSRASLTAAVVDNTPYHWQYRAIDETGRTSAWTPFGGNAETNADFTVDNGPGGGGPTDPGVPTPGQFQADGTTAISVGGTTTEATVVIASTLSDPDAGASIRLEVEMLPIGTAFAGAATHASTAVASGARASVSIPVTAGTSYHWRARAVDETGRFSAWVSFGGNADGTADVSAAAANAPPAAPSALKQFAADGTTAIATGGQANDPTVVLEGTVSDPDVGNTLRLEIELQPSAAAFTNTATHNAPGLASGAAGRVTVTLGASGGYKWQARTCDAAACSSWVQFGGNADTADDFVKP